MKKKKAKRYYKIPIKSKYVKDYAIHIRRTIAGNLVIVKRLIDPIERTIKFRFFENHIISFLLYNIGKICTKIRRKKM